jgi:hypothetical protein
MSTPRLDTTKGTRYVKADLSHTTIVASPRITTSSWLMRKSTVPTISAIEMVRTRCGGYRQTFGISRHVDQTGRDEEAVDLIWSWPAPDRAMAAALAGRGSRSQPVPLRRPQRHDSPAFTPRCSRRRRTAAAIVTAQWRLACSARHGRRPASPAALVLVWRPRARTPPSRRGAAGATSARCRE